MSASTVASEPLSEEKAAKIRSDLDVVRNNMTVFSEILTELNPSGGSNPGELDLLQELYKTCKEMQARVGQLLCTPTTDELTVDMLQINDDMNDLFDRYDRKTASYNLKSGDAPLIDFGGGEDRVVQNMGAMNLQSAKPAAAPADEFDQFVSSRTGNGGKEGKKGDTALTEEEIIRGHRETDFEEMEAWLKANPGAEASLTSMPAPIEGYLAQRGASGSDSKQDRFK